jgi:DNA-binding Lrp family transcriptional regulator
MTTTAADTRLLAAIADGLPLVPRPFAAVAEGLGRTEESVIADLRRLGTSGVIRRFGVIVRHHELGYTANAMTVWDIPDGDVDAIAGRMAAFPFVTLCYRRPRRPPAWPYNLFAMIHGKDRATVTAQVDTLVAELGLDRIPRDVLFSTRRFKQCGARFAAEAAA